MKIWVTMAFVAIVAVAGWWWSRSEQLDRQRVYRIGYDSNPPYQIANPSGDPSGLAVEVVGAAARTKGIRIEWVFLPEGPDAALRAGKADAWPMIVGSPARSEEFSLSRPWVTTSLWLVNRQGGSNDLQGAKLGVHRAPFPLQFAPRRFPRSIIVPFASRTAALESICRSEIQAALVESRNFLGLLLNRPKVCEAVALDGSPLPEATLAMSVVSTKRFSSLATTLRDGISDAAEQGLLASYFDSSHLGAGTEGSTFESLLRSEEANANLWKVLAALALSLLVVVLLAIRLRRTQRLAEAANLAKSRFLAHMSHEIRTPMNGVLGMAELLLAAPLPPRERELARTISSSGAALMTILNDILDMSKLEAGKFETEAIDYSLPEVLDSVRQTLEPLASSKGLELAVECDPRIPIWLKGDPVRISQILLNLGTNAVKFTERGSVRIEAGPSPGGALLLRVSDTGMGISEPDQAKLFKPFTQASASIARTHGGTGLGLAICHSLVLRMHGTIQLTSRPGGGTSFSVELPLRPGVPTSAPNSLAPGEVAAPRMRILVAEDNAVNQRVTRGLLEALGHTVDIAADGEEAVKCWAARNYDAILMDRQMPRMDGIEATQAIRKQEPKEQRVWIVALTASALDQDRRECLQSGMDDYIPKPVSGSALAAALMRVPRRRAEDLNPLPSR